MNTSDEIIQLGSQWPFEVWMAIDRKARLPKVSYPARRIVRFSVIHRPLVT
ncbi:MAG: hypothetical protein IAE85_19795 [Anaerolinea sp.]|nr:hypothetical protein [Anaerolinea sp.]